MSNITSIIYNFETKACIIHGPYEISKETEKCYFYKDQFYNRRISKNEIGKIIERSSYGGAPPYLQLSMINTDECLLRDELRKWFSEEAYRVCHLNNEDKNASLKKKEENMRLQLTDTEVKTLKFYLEKSLIDAEGLAAVGVGSQKTVDNLKSIMKKMDEQKENDKELWKVFRYEGKELCAYTLNSTFPGEERETKEFLSLEHNVPIKEIKVMLEKR